MEDRPFSKMNKPAPHHEPKHLNFLEFFRIQFPGQMICDSK